MRLHYIFFLALPILMASKCQNSSEQPQPQAPKTPDGTHYIEPYEQLRTGDPAEGYDYLRYGNYIGAGVPYDLFVSVMQDEENSLNREGDNSIIPPGYNAYVSESGVKAVGGITCFGCHGAKIEGKFIPGLGNSFSDWTQDQTQASSFLRSFIASSYGEDSPEMEEYEPLHRGAQAIAPYTQTPFKGVNPAFRIEEAAVAQRSPEDMTWLDEPYYQVPERGYFSDVPPLWNVDKKNGLYYNGMGRGDHTRMLQQVMVVAIEDENQAEEINKNFDDVLAWLETLEAPAYTQEIDESQAERGLLIFNENCSGCHGNYQEDSYPNLLVELDVVGTDPWYSQYFKENPGFVDWIKSSWVGDEADFDAYNEAPVGYVAPPLDGIWATAPYFHNGSVPTLYEVLKSSERPAFWSRDFNTPKLDYEKVGWQYTEHSEGGTKDIYDTTIPGYTNVGHTFGDDLSEEERWDLIEYLKTL